MSLLPPPEAIYPTPEAAFTAIQAHTKHQGYTIKKHDKKATRIIFTCDCTGKYNPKCKDLAVYKSKQCKATGSKIYRCLMIVELRFDHLSGN